MTDAEKLLPLEGDSYKWAALSKSFYVDKDSRPLGITFMLRAKNEEEKIQTAITSIHEQLRQKIKYNVVMIDNGSTDDTAALAKAVLRADNDVFVSYPAQVAKAGLETYVTPCNSVHSLPWFYQFCLQQCTKYSHVFKWDADFLMEPHLADYLVSEFTKPDGALPADRYEIHARNVGEDTYGCESYLMSIRLGYRYYRHFLWESWAYSTVFFSPVNVKVPHEDAHIVHDSELVHVKSYLKLPPWWETEPIESVKQMPFVQKAQQDYAHWCSVVGENQKFCRSMDPACDPLMRLLPCTNEHIQGLL